MNRSESQTVSSDAEVGGVNSTQTDAVNRGPGTGDRARGYAVHLLTVSGIFPAFAAMVEILSPDCDPRLVFIYLVVATIIDAVDGPLARRWQVKKNAPAFDGRTIDDLLDYLTFAFIPLMLVWRMDWLAPPWEWTVSVAMAASLFGFSNTQAKEEGEGFFRGFPSYWNIYAFYAGLFTWHVSPWLSTVLLWVLIVATVAPLRVLYPNLTPAPWKPSIMIGGAVWGVWLAAMLYWYPQNPPWVVWVSLIYPVYYTVLSIALDVRARQRSRQVSP